ncbi:hypothetical protein Mapa_014272 [Marchantia paleacea]|nr:hypothetical protein Mapa_014272 [Marchantia paleacea]
MWHPKPPWLAFPSPLDSSLPDPRSFSLTPSLLPSLARALAPSVSSSSSVSAFSSRALSSPSPFALHSISTTQTLHQPKSPLLSASLHSSLRFLPTKTDRDDDAMRCDAMHSRSHSTFLPLTLVVKIINLDFGNGPPPTPPQPHYPARPPSRPAPSSRLTFITLTRQYANLLQHQCVRLRPFWLSVRVFSSHASPVTDLGVQF